MSEAAVYRAWLLEELETLHAADVPAPITPDDALYDHLQHICGLVCCALLIYEGDIAEGRHHPNLIVPDLTEARDRLALLMLGLSHAIH